MQYHKYPSCFQFTSFSLSLYCCLHFWRIRFGSMLAQGYFKGQRSNTSKNVTFCELAQSICNHWVATIWCANKYPWCFFLLVHPSAVACIFWEIHLGPCCWRMDILRVKGQAQITKCYCAIAYISVKISLGSYWRRNILGVQGSSSNHKLPLFMSLWNQYAIIEW